MIKVLCLLMLLLLPGIAKAESVPGQFDWSPIQPLLEVESVEFPPPVKQDHKGNYHVFMPIASQGFKGINYIVIDSRGSELINQQLELDNFNSASIATGIATEDGALVIWATRDSLEGWRIYAASLNLAGQIVDTRELEISLQGDKALWQADYDELIYVRGLSADFAFDGSLHLSVIGGYTQNARFHYFRYSPDLELMLSNSTARHQPMFAAGSRTYTGGQVLAYGDGAWVLGETEGRMHLTWFDSQGQASIIDLPQAAFNVGNQFSSVYYNRRIGPMVVVDEGGAVHVVYNHVSKQPTPFSRQVIDIGYLMILDGEIVQHKPLSTQTGIAHYPTITIDHDGRIFVTWEEAQGSSYELYFAQLMDGEIVQPRTRLTWEKQPSRLGWVFGDNEGLQAFWWRPAGENLDFLAYKSTVNPPQPSIWMQLGIDPYDLDNSLVGQLAYYSVMVLVAGLIKLGSNLHILFYLMLVLYLLFKIGALDVVMQKPWGLYVIAVIGLYTLMPTVNLQLYWGSGYQLFAGVAAAVLTWLSFIFYKATPNTTLNLLLGCIVWMAIFSIILVIPIVPEQFTI